MHTRDTTQLRNFKVPMTHLLEVVVLFEKAFKNYIKCIHSITIESLEWYN